LTLYANRLFITEQVVPQEIDLLAQAMMLSRSILGNFKRSGRRLPALGVVPASL
jgi:hypothetical protein